MWCPFLHSRSHLGWSGGGGGIFQQGPGHVLAALLAEGSLLENAALFVCLFFSLAKSVLFAGETVQHQPPV